MRIAVDTDALGVLCAIGALYEVARELGGDAAELQVLPAAQHQFKRGRWAKKYSPECRERIQQSAAALPSVDGADAGPLASRYAALDGVDAGEAILLSCVASGAVDLLITGDERCLKALAEADADLIEPLKGKVTPLTACLAVAADCVSDTAVLLRSWKDSGGSHTTATVILSAAQAPGGHLAACESYLREVRELVPSVLHLPVQGLPP